MAAELLLRAECFVALKRWARRRGVLNVTRLRARRALESMLAVLWMLWTASGFEASSFGRASSCFGYSSARRSAASRGFFEVEDPFYDADTMRKRGSLSLLLFMEKTPVRRRFRPAARGGRATFFWR